MWIFLIAALGYLLGSITVKGMSLGTSGVLLVALVFGHFGVEIPGVVRNYGLVLFVGSVGLIAGPVFFRNFKQKVYVYLILGVFTVFIGAVTTLLLGKAFEIPSALAIGLFNGALTSTPGLAAALEATGDPMASLGYGIAYLIGVVGVVLFVQVYPKIRRCDLATEVEVLRRRLHGQVEPESGDQSSKTSEGSALMVLSLVLALGLLLGSVEIPLPGGLSFSLGTAGGPLFAGLIMGHFRFIGGISGSIPSSTLKVVREMGLSLFLIGAGTDAGVGFVQVLREYGWMLFGVGVIITLLPMVSACILSCLVLKLDTLTTLGSVCGGMTSTPALGALIAVSKTEDVVVFYAATYPFALICMVLSSQILALIW
jgi:putative transport protein